ncbi:DMT family transporter [Massilia sp. TS11]|uniref:DMT family transporter n=1 Tax=Massilia sp. TS11 TaxID=2908003 RepID=UPI001EDAF444|nr:DMT family transporter [Massilia sp. TS11]MCG2584037.1 DMT family transporter [Massilia sp. TS11]
MQKPISAGTALLLTVPPVLWAGNAVVGRLLAPLVPPMTLNLMRWVLALLILAALAWRSPAFPFRRGGAGLAYWRRLALLGLLGIGLYNSLQYLALQTSGPINVTLVAASMPVWMLVVGALFFRVPAKRAQWLGALLSVLGVLIVICHGDWHQLRGLRLVPGDVLMIVATIVWSFYSWMLVQRREPDSLRQDWAAFLLAQVAFGVLWSSLFAVGEWSLRPQHIVWGWPTVLGLLYVAVGPAVIAFRCWGAGVERAGPSIGSFFVNLTPLFAALLSAAVLGEAPHLYHGLAFALIVGGILVSRR